jgi:hypothetical protein
MAEAGQDGRDDEAEKNEAGQGGQCVFLGFRGRLTDPCKGKEGQEEEGNDDGRLGKINLDSDKNEEGAPEPKPFSGEHFAGQEGPCAQAQGQRPGQIKIGTGVAMVVEEGKIGLPPHGGGPDQGHEMEAVDF